LAIPDYSTEGPTDDGRMKPDLAAPTAVAVVGGYFSGTSAAAPHVGGEAALIWSQVAATTSGDVANAVAAHLRAIALDSGTPGPESTPCPPDSGRRLQKPGAPSPARFRSLCRSWRRAPSIRRWLSSTGFRSPRPSEPIGS